MEPRMTSSSPPTRGGRSAKSGSKKSFSEDFEEEEDFPETLRFDPVSPPRKLSLKSKVTLKRIDMAKVEGSPSQVAKKNIPVEQNLRADMEMEKMSNKANITKVMQAPASPMDSDCVIT